MCRSETSDAFWYLSWIHMGLSFSPAGWNAACSLSWAKDTAVDPFVVLPATAPPGGSALLYACMWYLPRTQLLAPFLTASVKKKCKQLSAEMGIGRKSGKKSVLIRPYSLSMVLFSFLSVVPRVGAVILLGWESSECKSCFFQTRLDLVPLPTSMCRAVGQFIPVKPWACVRCVCVPGLWKATKLSLPSVPANVSLSQIVPFFVRALFMAGTL